MRLPSIHIYTTKSDHLSTNVHFLPLTWYRQVGLLIKLGKQNIIIYIIFCNSEPLHGATLCVYDVDCGRVQCASPTINSQCESGICQCPPCKSDKECPLPCPYPLSGYCKPDGNCGCHDNVMVDGRRRFLQTCKVNADCPLPCPAGEVGFCDAGNCHCHKPCKTDSECPLPCPISMSGYCDSGTCRCH